MSCVYHTHRLRSKRPPRRRTGVNPSRSEVDRCRRRDRQRRPTNTLATLTHAFSTNASEFRAERRGYTRPRNGNRAENAMCARTRNMFTRMIVDSERFERDNFAPPRTPTDSATRCNFSLLASPPARLT